MTVSSGDASGRYPIVVATQRTDISACIVFYGASQPGPSANYSRSPCQICLPSSAPLDAANVDELYARGKRIPLGRIGQPEDVANGVCLLASEQASYITGQSLCVNGGALMR